MAMMPHTRPWAQAPGSAPGRFASLAMSSKVKPPKSHFFITGNGGQGRRKALPAVFLLYTAGFSLPPGQDSMAWYPSGTVRPSSSQMAALYFLVVLVYSMDIWEMSASPFSTRAAISPVV